MYVEPFYNIPVAVELYKLTICECLLFTDIPSSDNAYWYTEKSWLGSDLNQTKRKTIKPMQSRFPSSIAF